MNKVRDALETSANLTENELHHLIHQMFEKSLEITPYTWSSFSVKFADVSKASRISGLCKSSFIFGAVVATVGVNNKSYSVNTPSFDSSNV
jgi:hypothetical protein